MDRGRRVARTPRHVFYEKLNGLLAEAEFDAWVERALPAVLRRGGPASRSRRASTSACCWSATSRGSTASAASPGGVPTACRCERFLGYGPTEKTPDHSSLSEIRQRLPAEVFDEVFQFVLDAGRAKKLLAGKTVGVDSTTLEANAAMKSIVRKDTGEDWKEYVTRLMREEGVIERGRNRPTRSCAASTRSGRTRRSPTTSGRSPTDPDSRITQDEGRPDAPGVQGRARGRSGDRADPGGRDLPGRRRRTRRRWATA